MKPNDPSDGSTGETRETEKSTSAGENEFSIDEMAAEQTASNQQNDSEIELAEAQGRALRAQAELENYRKRSRREIEEGQKYAKIPLIRDLLPVIDNLQRALEAASQDAAAGSLKEGVQMVAQQLQSMLSQYHCVPIDAEGKPFDPNFHEAISELPHPEVERGHVAVVHQVGYRVHDRVVRPSQVIVSSGPAEA